MQMTFRQYVSLATCAGTAALLCGYAIGQGVPATPPAIPPTPPTSPAISSTPAPSAQAVPPAKQDAPAARPDIKFENGTLEVAANGASLNQILRQIQRKAGLKITGGVKDERVYGSYGPGPLSDVLGSLLDGTGSNMLLTGVTDTNPAELILTPRLGGPTPPSPNSMASDDDDRDRTPQQTVPIPNRGSMPPAGATNGIPPAPPPPPAQGVIGAPTLPPDTAPPADPSAVAPTAVAPATTDSPATPDTTTQQSPNGVATPQQIYQQLLQMQQKAQQQTPPQH
jgi:hypothetical protein